MECGDLSWSAAIYRRFSVKALAFTNLAVDPDGNEVLVGVEPDPPIRPMEERVPGRPFMTCSVFSGTTSVPLRGLLDAVEGAPPGRRNS